MKYTKIYGEVDCGPLGYEDTTATVWVNLTANVKDAYFAGFRGMFDTELTQEARTQAEKDYEDTVAEFIKEVRSGDEILTIDSREDLYKLRGEHDGQFIAYVVGCTFALYNDRLEKAKATFRGSLS